MSFPGPSTGLVWSRHWRRAVRQMKDQRGQAEIAVWVLTRQQQCLGSQVLYGKRKRVWGKPGEKGSRTQRIAVALFEGESPEASSSGVCLSTSLGWTGRPCARPGCPSEKEMDTDPCSTTGSSCRLYAALRCGCCELSPGQSPSRTEGPDGERFPVPSWIECPLPFPHTACLPRTAAVMPRPP